MEQHEDQVIDHSRLSLRPFDLSDVDDFLSWAGDERVCRFTSWEPHMTREEAFNFVSNAMLSEGRVWYNSICLDRKSIGEILVTPNLSPSNKCRAEIGYVVGSGYWGRGVATWAVTMVANSIFWEWPHLMRLEAIVDVENVASQRVLEKAGFEREGVLKNYFVFKGKCTDCVIFSVINPNV